MPTCLGLARDRELLGALGDVSSTFGPRFGVPCALRVLVLRAGHQRGLAHAERLKDRSHLAVQPHGAQPALCLVLCGVGEWDGRSRKRDHESRVLGEWDMPAVSQNCLRALPSTRLRIGRISKSLTPDTGCTDFVQADSSHSRIVTWRAARSPSAISRASSPSRPWRSATTLCLWIVSRFSWRAETKACSPRPAKPLGRLAHHLAHAVLHEARVHVRLLDHLDLVGALHQLVDLGAHRALDDVEQGARPRWRRRSPRGSRCGACRCRAGCGWRPARPRRRARSRRR